MMFDPDKKQSRRGFLKLFARSAVGAAATTLAGCSTSGSSVTSRIVTNPKPPQRGTAPSATNLVLNEEARQFLIEAAKPIAKAAGFDFGVEVNNMTLQEVENVEGTSFKRLKERLNIFITDEDSVNASVREDGTYNIYINKGVLLQAKTPSEIQFVIAHELGHIVAKDIKNLKGEIKEAKQRVSASQVLTIGINALGGILDPQNAGNYSNIAQAASRVYTQSELDDLKSFIRDRERAADDYAIAMFNEAGIGFENVIKLFECMEHQNGHGHSAPGQGTHPVTASRIKAVSQANRGKTTSENPRLVSLKKTMHASLGGPNFRRALCNTPGHDHKATSITEQLDAQRKAQRAKNLPGVTLKK